MISREVVVAWARMKAAECAQEIALAKAVDMESLAAPFARDVNFFLAAATYLEERSADHG